MSGGVDVLSAASEDEKTGSYSAAGFSLLILLLAQLHLSTRPE